MGAVTDIIVSMYYLQHFVRVLDRFPALLGFGNADDLSAIICLFIIHFDELFKRIQLQMMMLAVIIL